MTRLARWLVALAARVLPVQERRRYEAELDTDVLALPRAQRLGYALGVLAAVPLLRWELLVVLCGDASPVSCWFAVHHDLKTHPNPQDHTVIAFECRACHRPRDPDQWKNRTEKSTRFMGFGYG